MSLIMQRIRIIYQKTEPLRYTSNLDMQKIWERTLRRAHIPIAYSMGFHPQPRINQACPLPLGITSLAEVVDIWLNTGLSVLEVKTFIENVEPPGISLKCVEIVNPLSPSLQSQVTSSEYLALLNESTNLILLNQKIESILSVTTLFRQRRGKTYDLRPLLEELELLPTQKTIKPRIHMKLAARSNATGRPDEVLDAIGIDSASSSLLRIALWINEIRIG
jgi:radical SAM-linked protein